MKGHEVHARTQVKRDARSLASLVDEQLSACRALRSDATVQKVLSENHTTSTQTIHKQCAYLLLTLKSDIRELHQKIAFATDASPADVFRRTRQLEENIQQAGRSNDKTTNLLGVMRLLELKESMSVDILSKLLNEKKAFDEESLHHEKSPLIQTGYITSEILQILQVWHCFR